MIKFDFQRTVLGFALASAAFMFGVGSSVAQVFYPMEIAVVNPDTGASQNYTVYVPTEAQSGATYTAKQVVATNTQTGATETQTIYIPTQAQSAAAPQSGVVSANPWAVENTSTLGTATLSSAPTTVSSVASTQRLRAASGTTVSNPRDEPLPAWVGQNTTFNTAMGQEMIAPEINKTNMISMVQHLRRLGFIVPDSLDTAIAEAPSKTKVAMINSLQWVQGGGDATSSPILKTFAKISKDLENNYGFKFDNILGTSMDILDAR